MAQLPPFYLDCVTAIGGRNDKGEVSYTATGFLFGRFRQKDPSDASRALYGVYLVTNRHVFEGRRNAVLRFNPPPGHPGREYDLDLVDGKGSPIWESHDDPTIDVAAISIAAPVLRQHGIQFSYFHSDQHLMGREKANESGVCEGDGIFLLGFPLGDTGGERNYVVVRHGVIARIRDYLAGASKNVIVDASVFPGNSGGPVVTRLEPMAIVGTKGHNSSLLLGVVSAYIPYRDVAVSQQTGMPRVIFEENSGLTLVVPVDFVSEVVEKAEARRHAVQESQATPGAG